MQNSNDDYGKCKREILQSVDRCSLIVLLFSKLYEAGLCICMTSKKDTYFTNSSESSLLIRTQLEYRRK